MKILQFIESGGPGGAEQVVLTLLELLRERGHDVHVATLRLGWLSTALRERGFQHTHLQSKRRLDAHLPFKLAALAREQGSEIIHSHLLDSNFYASLAAKLAGIGHVATEHGDVHHPQKKRMLRTKLTVASHLGSAFTAVSKFTAAALEKCGCSNVTVIGNPIKLPHVDADLRNSLRESEHLSPNTFVWLNVANLRPVKDQKTLLAAFRRVLDQTAVDQQLLILGEGPERESLHRFAGDLNLLQNVRFLGFQKVSPYLQAADAFVLTSLSEALPMSLLEAGSHSLPVVASAVGGIPEVISDGRTGLLVQPQDESALAEAMSSLVNSAESRLAMGQELCSEITRNFSEEIIISRFLEFYEKTRRRKG